MITRYAVVRYYPDRLCGEFRNIGIVAWGREDWAQRLIPDLPRDLAEYAELTIDELHRQLDRLTPEERIDGTTAATTTGRMAGPYASVCFREPCASILGEASALVDEVWPHFCSPDTGLSFGRWVWEAGVPAGALGKGQG